MELLCYAINIIKISLSGVDESLESILNASKSERLLNFGLLFVDHQSQEDLTIRLCIWKLYLDGSIYGAKEQNEAMDAIFPVSIDELFRVPERSPVKEPNDISE